MAERRTNFAAQHCDHFRWREDTIKSTVSHFLAPVMVNDKIYVARRALVLSSYQYRRQRVNCFVISLQHGGDNNIADGNSHLATISLTFRPSASNPKNLRRKKDMEKNIAGTSPT